MDDPVAPGRLPPLPDHAPAGLGQAADRPDRPAGIELLLRAQGAQVQVAGRGAEGTAGHLRQARRAAARARQAGRRGGGRGVRLGIGGHHLPQGAGRQGRDLLLDLRSHPRIPGAGAQVPGLGGAGGRQLLRRAEFGGVLRRQLRVRAQGRALPDGAEHLLPHQRQQHRPVRAHPDHLRGQGLRVLPGRLHRADARREPAACGGGGAGGAGRCRDQVFHRAELVSGRRERRRRHLQLRHQARRMPRCAFQGDVDAGGNRLGNHLEVPVLRAAGR